MNRRIRKHYDILHLLARCKCSKQFKALLSNADKETVRCLCECIQNVLMGNIPLSDSKTKKLKTHRTTLRRIIDKRTRLKEKRKLLSQTGGFLPLLLAPIVGLAGSLIGDAIAGVIRK